MRIQLRSNALNEPFAGACSCRKSIKGVPGRVTALRKFSENRALDMARIRQLGTLTVQIDLAFWDKLVAARCLCRARPVERVGTVSTGARVLCEHRLLRR